MNTANEQGDICVRIHKGAYIYICDDTKTFYWENCNGVVGGDDFDNVDDCMSDIDADEDYRKKRLRGPYAYLG